MIIVSRMSHTLVNLFQRCELQAWFYLFSGPQRPKWQMSVGVWGHDAIAKDSLHRIETKEQLPLKEFCGVFEQWFDSNKQHLRGCSGGDRCSCPETTVVTWQGADPGEIKTAFLGTKAQSGRGKPIHQKTGILPHAHENHLPLVEPELVEDEFRIVIPEDEKLELPETEVKGYIDFYGNVPSEGRKKKAVVDWKFRSRATKTAAKSNQLTLYGIALEARGKRVQSFEEHSLIFGQKGGPKIDEDRAPQDGTRYERVMREVQLCMKQMNERGEDPTHWSMTTPDNWMCSLDSCGWARMCPRFGGNYE